MVEQEKLEDGERQWKGRRVWGRDQMWTVRRSRLQCGVHGRILALCTMLSLGRRNQGWTTRAAVFAKRDEIWGVWGPKSCHFLS